MRRRILSTPLYTSGGVHTEIIPGGLSGNGVTMPRAWLPASEALAVAHKQTGLKYAVVPDVFEGTVGPYRIGEEERLDDIVAAVAKATGTAVHVVDDATVFEPADTPGADLPDDLEAADVDDRAAELLRGCIRRMSIDGRSVHVPALTKLVWHENRSVGYQALAALHRLEGDFLANQWPGRVSIFELLSGRIHEQSLFWAVEEYGHGTTGWKMILDILARARHPYLFRHTWVPGWYGRAEAILPSLVAMARSGDASCDRTLRNRLVEPGTNDPTERYIAAIGLGNLNMGEFLAGEAEHENAEVRQAAALGLGLCESSDVVVGTLETLTVDSDPGVRFVACLSLGQLACDESVGRLLAILNDEGLATEMRVAALEGLALAGTSDAVTAVVGACSSPDAGVRACAADVLGRLGGLTALKELPKLLDDPERWVRGAAASALGKLGDSGSVSAAAKTALDADAGPDEQIAAIIGLGAGRSPDAAPALSEVALDVSKHRRLRRYAVLALVQLAGRAGQDTLQKLATYGADEYMPFALTHVELETADETAKFVARFLARGHRATSAGAATRLMTLGSPWGVRELLEGDDVFDNHARNMHRWGSISAEGPGVVDVLVEAAGSRREVIRRAAAMALGGRRDVAAVDALIELTGDVSEDVRSNAAQQLGLCGDPKGVPHLIRLAEDDDSMLVAAAAIRVLRLRDFKDLPDVKRLFRRLAGTPRDCGVIDLESPSVEDQPANSFVLRRWGGSLEDDSISNVTYESALTYDSHRRRIVLWGAHGRRVDCPQTSQTWFYEAGGHTWKRLLDTHERPNETCITWGILYDRSNQVLLSPRSGLTGGHGWLNALRVQMQYSVPWLLDCRRDEWYPAKPPEHLGDHVGLPGGYDQRHAICYWWRTGGMLNCYDAYSNAWTPLSQSDQVPAERAGRGGVEYDPKTGRYLFFGKKSVWAFDPTEGEWTDLEPEGAGLPEGLTAYDSANDVVLQFRPQAPHSVKPIQVAVYHIRENRWEHLPEVTPAPHHGSIDVAYDEARNVTVISAGLQTWTTGQPTVQETWTYRYQPRPEKCDALGSPDDMTVVTKADGTAEVSWSHPMSGDIAAYRIDRGRGEVVWKAEWEKIADLPPDQTTFVDHDLDAGEKVFYRVTATSEDGRQEAVSAPGRTDPPAVRWADAVRKDDGIHIAWQPSPAADVVGYHVYRAPVEEAAHWDGEFDHGSLSDRFERITTEPVAATRYVDADAEPTGEPSEYHWPAGWAYEVRPVNALGVEGGRGPVTLALPGATGRVRVVPWHDGRRLVLWSPPRGVEATGYFVMRQDDWNLQHAFRWHPAPIVGYGFWDDREFPREDRRRYYVYGVDAAGSVGIPSAGTWSHGLP